MKDERATNADHIDERNDRAGYLDGLALFGHSKGKHLAAAEKTGDKQQRSSLRQAGRAAVNGQRVGGCRQQGTDNDQPFAMAKPVGDQAGGDATGCHAPVDHGNRGFSLYGRQPMILDHLLLAPESAKYVHRHIVKRAEYCNQPDSWAAQYRAQRAEQIVVARFGITHAVQKEQCQQEQA